MLPRHPLSAQCGIIVLTRHAERTVLRRYHRRHHSLQLYRHPSVVTRPPVAPLNSVNTEHAQPLTMSATHISHGLTNKHARHLTLPHLLGGDQDINTEAVQIMHNPDITIDTYTSYGLLRTVKQQTVALQRASGGFQRQDVIMAKVSTYNSYQHQNKQYSHDAQNTIKDHFTCYSSDVY